jgi:type I restriction enzyme, R subunit
LDLTNRIDMAVTLVLNSSLSVSICFQRGNLMSASKGFRRKPGISSSDAKTSANERFGTDFNQADQLFFDQVVEAAMADDSLRAAAAVNPGDKFELLFRNVLEQVFAERMDQNEDIFVRYMNDQSFRKVVTTWMSDQAYRRFRSGVRER